MSKEAVRKFNEDSATAAAEASASKPEKAMPKKPAHKPSSSATLPSRPNSSKPSWHIPQEAPVPTVAKPLNAAAKSSTPAHLASCQRTTSISIASGASASSSAPPQSSRGPTLLKKKATARRGTRPSPHKKRVAFQVPSSEDEADDDE